MGHPSLADEMLHWDSRQAQHPSGQKSKGGIQGKASKAGGGSKDCYRIILDLPGSAFSCRNLSRHLDDALLVLPLGGAPLNAVN